MRKLRNSFVLLDGNHWRIEFERRLYGKGKDANVAEIVHITHKKQKGVSEFYSSDYVIQSEIPFHFKVELEPITATIFL